jgi:hypothetical protein
MPVSVTVEPMRNENSVAFILDKTLIPPGTGNPYSNRESAQGNPLAKALFEIKGVHSIWVLGNEVQVTKDDETTWGALKGRVVETIKQNA